MLALYGHPFSSYTWKALIALYAHDTPFEFRILDDQHPEHGGFVSQASPLGKFPVLEDDGIEVFEATSIIEHLDAHHPGEKPLVPWDDDDAVHERMIDRVFDNYVMGPMQDIVAAHIASPGSPDAMVVDRARGQLGKSYAWLEDWLGRCGTRKRIGLIECAAAPSLFYADWVHPIPDGCPRLRAWRARLLAMPPVARCVDEARPYRHYFPLGAPDRD